MLSFRRVSMVIVFLYNNRTLTRIATNNKKVRLKFYTTNSRLPDTGCRPGMPWFNTNSRSQGNSRKAWVRFDDSEGGSKDMSDEAQIRLWQYPGGTARFPQEIASLGPPHPHP